MIPRYLTVSCFGQVLEATYLRDVFDRPTLDPALAERCIVTFPDGNKVAATVDECPIYTIH